MSCPVAARVALIRRRTMRECCRVTVEGCLLAHAWPRSEYACVDARIGSTRNESAVPILAARRLQNCRGIAARKDLRWVDRCLSFARRDWRRRGLERKDRPPLAHCLCTGCQPALSRAEGRLVAKPGHPAVLPTCWLMRVCASARGLHGRRRHKKP